jgi:staphylococcal nuclease domain-containing protein 1
MRAVQTLLENVRTGEKDSTPLRVGDVVAARFAVDNILYRARVSRIMGEKITVLYVDYGNTEVLGRDRIWTSNAIKTSTESYPPLATQVSVAFLSPSLSEDFMNDASLCLRSFVQDYCDASHPLLSKVEYQDGQGRKYISIQAGTQGTVQEHLIKTGLARIEGRFLTGPLAATYREAVKPLEKLQDKAKSERLQIWQYGEVYSDDDE